MGTPLYRAMTNGDYPVPEAAQTRWVVPILDRQMERLGWVPTDQLEEAVEALEQIARHGDMPAGEPWQRAYVEVVMMARDALAKLRGQ
jgi:hypothetical protein